MKANGAIDSHISDVLLTLGFEKTLSGNYVLSSNKITPMEAVKNEVRREYHRRNAADRLNIYLTCITSTLSDIAKCGYAVPSVLPVEDIDFESGRETQDAAATMVNDFSMFIYKYKGVVGAQTFLRVRFCLNLFVFSSAYIKGLSQLLFSQVKEQNCLAWLLQDEVITESGDEAFIRDVVFLLLQTLRGNVAPLPYSLNVRDSNGAIEGKSDVDHSEKDGIGK